MLAGWSFTLCCPASTAPKNYIDNGNFEDGGTRWRGDKNIVFETPKKKNNVCEIKVDTEQPTNFYQEINTSKCKQFTLKLKIKKSSDYKSEGLEEFAVLIELKDGGGGPGITLPNNNDWNELECSIGEHYLKDARRVKIIFEVMPAISGSLFFDDITLMESSKISTETSLVILEKDADVSAKKSSATADGYHTFTDKRGRKIEAKIIRISPDGLEITVERRKPNTTITVPLTAFDAETQSYIKSWGLR